MSERPTIAELRAVTQPEAVMGRVNAEHWTGRLYLRRLSPYLTRLLLLTSISANGVTGLMILTGSLSGVALLVPGIAGALLCALLAQLQMLWDCCDGEVARWRQQFSAAGTFLDKVGHYAAESLIPLGLGVRADGGLGQLGGWTTAGAVLALLVVLNKALNDMVHVARSVAGLPRLEDREAVKVPRSGGLSALRSVARFVPFHRLYHSIELSLIVLLAAVGDAVVGGLDVTRVVLAVLVPAAALTVVGHTVAILSSSRLR